MSPKSLQLSSHLKVQTFNPWNMNIILVSFTGWLKYKILAFHTVNTIHLAFFLCNKDGKTHVGLFKGGTSASTATRSTIKFYKKRAKASTKSQKHSGRCGLLHNRLY